MDKTLYAYVIGAEFLVSLVLHLLAIVKTCKILRKFLRIGQPSSSAASEPMKVSIFLLALLVDWLLTALSYVPKEIYILSVWRPNENLRNGDWIFWSYMPSLCQYSTVSVFVLFLTLERICIIRYPGHYQQGPYVKNRSAFARPAMLFTTFLLAALVWLANFVAFIRRLPIATETECWTFTCLVGDGGMDFYLASRVAVAVPNCIGSLAFLGSFLRYNKQRLAPVPSSNSNLAQPSLVHESRKRARVNRYNNLLCLWAICSEFLLNFIPYFGPLIVQQLTGLNVVANVGVFASMLSALEGILFVGIYSRVVRRMEKASSSNSQLVGQQTQRKIMETTANSSSRRPTQLEPAVPHAQNQRNSSTMIAGSTTVALRGEMPVVA